MLPRLLLLTLGSVASVLAAAEAPTFHIPAVEVTVRRGGVWTLAETLPEKEHLFLVSPAYTVSRRRFWNGAEQAVDLQVIHLQVSRERPWSESEMDGATIHFAWLRDGKIEWARELPALPKLHASGAVPAQAVLALDGAMPLEGSPVVLLSKDGAFLPPRRWFADPVANRVAFKLVAGLPDGLDEDIAGLVNPDVQSSLHRGVTLAHLAAEAGNVQALQLLAERGADLDTEADGQETPLTWAVLKGRAGAVEWLLEHGVRARSDARGQHPIELALHAGHMEVAAALYRRARTHNFRDEMLGVAAWMGDGELSRELLADYSDFRLRWIDGEPLWWIAQSHDVELMELMLDRGVGVGRRPSSVPMLNLAARAGDVAMVRLLLDRGAGVDGRAPSGKTALIEATLQGFPEVAALLVERGARVDRRDKEGRSALDYAQQRGDARLIAALAGEALPPDPRQNDRVWLQGELDTMPQVVTRPEFVLMREDELDARAHYRGQVVTSSLFTVSGPQVTGEIPGQELSYSITTAESTEHMALWSGIVETDGTLSQTEVLRAGPGRFWASVEGAMGDYRFEPGIKHGQPVRTRVVWLEDLR